ncbi:FACT complex subunit spt16, partial [Guillardia theta CCMP2712]
VSAAMFSLELHDILTVLCPKKIIFLAASKKARVLQALADDLPSKFPTKVEVRVRDKSDKDKANFQYILGEMKEERSETKVGTLLKEKYDGSFAQEWNSFLGEASGISKVDITNGLTDFLAIKSDKQVEAARQAGTINTAAFKSCLNKILDVVDSNEKFMLTKISEHVENELPKTIAPLQLPVDVEDVEVVIPPNVQSGTYDLKYSALTEESPLNLPDKGVPAIYISSVSLRVKSCFGMLARTLLFNVKPEQEANYRLLLEVVEKCQGLLKPGTRMNKVYEAASDLLKSKKPSLLGNLTKELGWSLGYELREKRFVFDEKNRSTLKVGMLVCLRIGLENLSIQSKDPKSSKYSMLLADTFLITKDGAECLTNAPKKHSKVSWNVSDDGDEEKKSDNKKSVQDELDRKLKELEKQKLSHKLSEEEKEQARKDFEERNNQLALQRVEEQRRRRYNESSGSDDKRERSQTSGYLGTEDFPSRAWSNKGYLQLYIDEAAQTILVPINGLPVPFHISTVKNASIQSQGIAGNVLRINFVSPGAGVSIGVNKDAIYLRELSYRAQESQNLILVHQQIMAMKKTYQQEERERKARDELVPQEPLRLNPNRGPRLQNLRIYPNIQARGRKTEGDLEAHVNGFRFAVKKAPSPDLKHIDILYRNIKHAFFQPSNKHSNLILLHFRLKNAIMIGKQSTRDIQFFLEWLEDGESLMENKRKNPYDRDEIEDEQRQKEMVSKLDREFKKFCDKVQELLPPYDPSNPGGDKIWDWDIPYVELEFQGNPKVSS